MDMLYIQVLKLVHGMYVHVHAHKPIFEALASHFIASLADWFR